MTEEQREAAERVGGGAVEVVPGAVVAAGGAGVAVPRRALDVLQGDADGEDFGGEPVAQAVRLDQVGGGNAGGLGQAWSWLTSRTLAPNASEVRTLEKASAAPSGEGPRPRAAGAALGGQPDRPGLIQFGRG